MALPAHRADLRRSARACRESAGTLPALRPFGGGPGGAPAHDFRLVEPNRKGSAANCGSYTLPVFDEPFPFGLGGTALTGDERRDLFARSFTLVLGDADNDPNHHQLPREPGAMRQGPHRFARGLHYMSVACREAAALGVPLAWKLRIAPGVAHSNPGIAPFAAQALFD